MTEAVDVSVLLALRQLQAPGKPDAVARIVGRFLEESEERVATLRAAIAGDEALSLERSAHALKGIAGTVGANEMLELAVRLEQIGREGHTRGAAELVNELGSAFTRARPVFQRLMDTAPTP
jgi:HPt (histidine-containing phosphotransfer) domain-containing protein